MTEYDISDAGGLAILEQLTRAYDRAESARSAIEREGETFRDRFDQPKPHPLLAVERDARAQVVSCVKSLNLDLEPLRDRPGRPGGS